MSKAAAIYNAVRIQLASEQKPDPGLMGCLGVAQGATPASYSPNTIGGFLANVASRLRADTPPLVFNWNSIDRTKCLNDQLWVVEQDMAAATAPLPMHELKEAPKP
jgi:hypothetical protein